MMQPPWLGFPTAPFDPAPTPLVPGQTFPPLASTGSRAGVDAIAQSWFAPGSFGSATPFGTTAPGGGIYGLVQSIVTQLQNLVARMFGEGNAERGPQQRVADATFSSTGDPHLAETGTLQGANGTQAIDTHFDSMVAHRDLVHSTDIVGGYRVSTEVTTPDAKGITWNRSATVHANFDQDRVSMDASGSVSIVDQNRPLSIAPGRTLTLSGGETVALGTDGALVVSASDGYGGTIATTMRANGSGVDVSTRAQNIDVGGDIATNTARPETLRRR